MDKIYTANDRAREEHDAEPVRRPYRNHRERLLFDFNLVAAPGFRGKIAVWNGQEGNDQPIKAYINGGRWLVKCECGGVEMVEPDDPIFFCHECGNQSVGGKSRPVIFPKDRKKIEAELLKIPQDTAHLPAHLPPSQRSAAAQGKRRDWEDQS